MDITNFGSQHSVIIPERRNRRISSRIDVQFRTVMCANRTQSEGSGMVLDLSIEGCRIRAPFAMDKSALMDLRIDIPDMNWTIVVDQAIVEWVKGNTFGVRFVSLSPEEGID